MLAQVIVQTQTTPQPVSGAYNWGVLVGYLAGIIIVALLMGHIAGKLGKSAGANYWMFAALGIFLGILGVVIALIYYFYKKSTRGRVSYDHYQTQASYAYLNQPPPPPPPPRESFAGGKIDCSNCSAYVPAGDEFCWNCGLQLIKRKIAKLCPLCHSELPQKAEFCIKCGAKLDVQTP